jgi:hypothetical protein
VPPGESSADWGTAARYAALIYCLADGWGLLLAYIIVPLEVSLAPASLAHRRKKKS